MALLKSNKESKEVRQEQKMQAQLDYYHIGDLQDEEIREAAKSIISGMTANKFLDAGIALSGKADDIAKIAYLRVLTEQNFVLIRQLDKLLNK